MIITPTIVAAVVVATAVPLVFLVIIRKLDLYSTGTFRTVALCFVWGWFAFGGAYLINQTMLDNNIVSEDIFRWFTAPIVEEILKSLLLIYLIRRIDFNYFVDGAIYGFAIGIGFAIVENYYYLYYHQDAALGLAIARVLSTNLIHPSGSALIGIFLGLSRFEKFPRSLMFGAAGYALAIALHIGYNNLVTRIGGGLLLLYAAGVGFGSGGLIFFLIKRGLSDEKKMIEETIVQETTVTAGESAIVNRLSDAGKILAPLSRKFGPKKAKQAEHFLTLQAQLGIKRKMVEKLPDPKMKQATEAEMVQIRAEMDAARRALGAYIMMYIRIIFPENSSLIYNRLETILSERAAQPATGGPNAFAILGGRISAAAPRPAGDEPGDPNG